MSQAPPSLPETAVADAQSPPVLSYFTPVAHQGSGAWREGKRLIITKGIELPPLCIKCNAPAAGRPKTKTLYWHHPSLFILVAFPGILIYAIVALCVRQKARVTFSLCGKHRSRRRWIILIAWLIFFAGLTALVVGATLIGKRSTEMLGVTGVISGVLAIAAAAIMGVGFIPTIAPTRIKGNYAWLKGAGPDFLANFPSTGR